MRVRTVLIALAVTLAVAALAVEWQLRSLESTAVPGTALRDASPRDAAASTATVAEDFALLELAVETTPLPYVPYAFLVEVRDASGAWTKSITEPCENGVALFGPLCAGDEVRVTVESGGRRFGYESEPEVVGESRTTVGPQGGRQFLVVPTRPWHAGELGNSVQVRDEDGWAVPGARTIDVASGEVIEADQRGWCFLPRDVANRRFEVRPPAARPDLGPASWSTKEVLWGNSVRLSVQHRRDVSFPRLVDDARRELIDRVSLRTPDERAWARDWHVGEGGVLGSVPLGRFVASWCVGGRRREGVLSVDDESVTFEEGPFPAPSAPVVVRGIGELAMEDTLVLVERSPRTGRLPLWVLEQTGYEMGVGVGLTNWFALAHEGSQPGTREFPNVPPGRYEIRTRTGARLVSRCVTVPEFARGPVEVAADFRPREGRIHGTVRGKPERKAWCVEARVHGEFSVSKDLHVGESYEFTGLAPGIYSVWVSREDWGAQSIRGEPMPQSPWKNVVVEAGGSVSLDFDVR